MDPHGHLISEPIGHILQITYIIVILSVITTYSRVILDV
jgi:hypothetical protein